MDSVPRTPPSPPGQCPPPGRSWPLSLQDSQSCRRRRVAARAEGHVRRAGLGETWLGCGGAAEAKASSSGRWASALRKVGEDAGGEWGAFCPCLASSPAWSPGCPQAVKPGMVRGGRPQEDSRPQESWPWCLVPCLPRGLPSVPGGPLSRPSPVVTGYCPSGPAVSPGPAASALQVGEGVAGASAALPELAGAHLLPSGPRVLLVSGCWSVCLPCPYASSACRPLGCPSRPESMTNPALPWHGRRQALLAQLPLSGRVF